MKSLIFSLILFPMMIFSSEYQDYRRGIEKAKQDILDHIDLKITQTYYLFRASDTDEFFYEISGQLDVYNQMKIHLKSEFKKDIWDHPMSFSYP